MISQGFLITASQTFGLYLISTSVTYLTPPSVLPDLTHVVLDPLQPFTLPAFTSSDSRFPVVYELKEVTGSGALIPIDPAVITFDAASLSGALKMISDNSLAGQRTYELSARYNIPINYKVTKTFKLNILHQCTRNMVTPVPFAFPTYFVADPSIMVTLTSWHS